MTEHKHTKPKQAWIGGPGTCLPRPLESFLGWSLALGCLSVSGYHYVVATFVSPAMFQIRLLLRKLIKHDASEKVEYTDFPCWLPLTTCSRDELARGSPRDRFSLLLDVLRKITKQTWTDENLIHVIRSNEVARRLASLAMRPMDSTAVKIDEDPAHSPLGQQLIRVWPDLLRLPPPPSNFSEYAFDISLIVPVYRELGSDVKRKLTKALESCRHPKRIEVVVVDAGFNTHLELLLELQSGWGELRILPFTAGGGRGPCLNFGASQARGAIYTFCHSDTTLPDGWDGTIVDGLSDSSSSCRANSCAFSFGIDTTHAGLNGGHFPPGIRAVELTANLRTHMYSLPYGDQVLSVPAAVFEYVGGYPDQCLMEDYELISLLRRRAALLHKFGIEEKDKLVILKGPPALCSPRRWQKFGVLYVTFMNSKFVNLYAGGMTPDAIFRLYYGQSGPARASELSPWEQAMNEL